MKRLRFPALLALLTVLLYGCPYESKVGIDNGPTMRIKTELLGTWHKSNYPSDSTELVFSKASNVKYNLKITALNSDKKYDIYTVTAWFSKAGSQELMTLYNANEKSYYFGELVMKDGRISLVLLSDEITDTQYDKPGELKQFIEELYKNDEVKYDYTIDLTNLGKVP
ncbi:MAG: hypothetical protein JST86_04750 [Bacteroidetes bacterium]|nr:hypothetical protein [Bacteroidota bacterium]